MIEYKYILTFDDLQPTEVFPIWGRGQKAAMEKDADYQFARVKITGPFKFVREDYALINDATFATRFGLTIYQRDRNTTQDWTVSTYHEFYKTDCNLIDQAEEVIQVEPTTLDDYQIILDNMDKEFDLYQLAPPIHNLLYYTQPVFQFVAIGQSVETVVNNVLLGVSFEQEMTTIPLGGGDLILNYQFAYMGTHAVVYGEDLSVDVTGEYVTEDSLPVEVLRSKIGGLYRITVDDPGAGDPYWVIKEVSSGTELYKSTEPISAGSLEDLLLEGINGNTGQCRVTPRAFYGRYLTNELEVNGTPSEPIPEDDIVPQNPNYSRVIRIGALDFWGEPIQDIIVMSVDNQEEPTQYKKIPSTAFFYAGQYFKKPDLPQVLHPINQSRWGQASYWVRYNENMKTWQTDAATQRTTDCYKLSEVIQVLLQEIGSTVTHEDTPAHSQFLYNQLVNPIRQTNTVLVITPKAKIIVGENQEPQRQAIIKLSDIFTLLQAEKCGWHIEDGRLVIEHDEFYHRGRSYGSQNISVDLSTLIEPKTGKPWDHHERKYSYEKNVIASRIDTEWMDESSPPFRGFPIKVLSPFADQSKVDTITAVNFSADIDFMQIASDRVSKDGFFVGEALDTKDGFDLPFVTIDLGNIGEYVVQNGYLAFIYLQWYYHKYVAPAEQLNINFEDVTAESTVRPAIQPLKISSLVISNDGSLVQTSLGVGRVRSYIDSRDESGGELILEHGIIE